MIIPSLFFDFGPGIVKGHSSWGGEKYNDTKDALFFLKTFKTSCKSTSVIKSQLKMITSVWKQNINIIKMYDYTININTY